MLKRNIIYGFRILIKNPGFSIIAVLTLALGIGAVTSQFSILNGVLFKGLPFPENHELVHIERVNVEEEFFNAEVPMRDFLEWEGRQSVFENMTPFFPQATVNVTIDGQAVRYTGSYIWHNFEETLGVQPILGGGFVPEDAESGAPMRVIIGYAAWQNDFSGNPNVVGKSVVVNGRPGSIAGVMPQGFEFPIEEQVWVPLTQMIDPADATWDGDDVSFEVLARLAEGRTLEEASTELSTIMQRIAEEHPDTRRGFTYAEIRPFAEEFTPGDVIQVLSILMGVVFIILGIACVNVANLLLARGALRVKEIAIRSALGASRLQIMIQMLTESLILALAGAVGGALLSLWAVDYINDVVHSSANPPPFWMTFDMDTNVLVFVILVTLLSGLVSGLIPAFRASKTDVNDVLKENTRGGSGISLGKIARALVILQIACCCLLLIFSGLFAKSAHKVLNKDFGFDMNAFMVARAGLFEDDYPEPRDRVAFFRRVVQGLDDHPKVESAAVTNRPRFRSSYGTNYRIEGEAYDEESMRPFCRWEAVSPGYFELLGVGLLEGRMFTSAMSVDDPREIVVNASMADLLRNSGSGEVIGRRLRYDFDDEQVEWWTVVGVAPDLLMEGTGNRSDNPRFNTPAGFYRPLYTEYNPNIRFMSILAKPREPADLADMRKILREEVRRVDPNIPLYWVDTPRNLVDGDQQEERLISELFLTFGLVALTLSAIGLYGVISFSVNQRRNEIGVRMALGADGRQVVSMVFRQGMLHLGIGLAVGLGLAALGANTIDRYAGALLYEVHPWDFTIFAGVVLFLSLIAGGATLLPALRAARIQPMEALRYE